MNQLLQDNLFDYYLIESGFVVILLSLFALVGMCMGWMMTRKSRKKLAQLERNRRDLLDRYNQLHK